jgi:hypothetical protein
VNRGEAAQQSHPVVRHPVAPGEVERREPSEAAQPPGGLSWVCGARAAWSVHVNPCLVYAHLSDRTPREVACHLRVPHECLAQCARRPAAGLPSLVDPAGCHSLRVPSVLHAYG